MNVILIVKLLAVLLVGSIALSKAMAFAKKDTIFRTNTAEDLKMMIDTLAGVSGDAIVEYPSDVSGYSFILNNRELSVFKKGEAKAGWTTRIFFLPESYSAQGVVEGEAKICLEKKSKVILLRKCLGGIAFTEPAPSSEIKVPQKIQSKFEPGFLEKVNSVSAELGINPNYLLAVMYFETGGTFSPSQKNVAGSEATGLIQFMPLTAEALGTTTEDLAKMTQVQQMDYVKKYFEINNGKNVKTLSDAYMVVLYPAAVGKQEEYALFKTPTKAYELNKGLDASKDGTVTKKEASSRVAAAYEKVTGEAIS